MDCKPILSVIDGVPRHPDYRMAEPVSLQIYPGEQVAIVGPNASGKTRLIDILTGRYPLLGTNEVHYHFPDSPHHFVSENIRILSFRDSYGENDTTYYLQQRWNQHDIDESTPMVDGRYLISLSSGELRKYQLQKALASSPRLLILDSPFIGLDPDARQQLRDTLKELIKGDGESKSVNHKRPGLQVVLLLTRDSDIPDFINRVFRLDNLKIVEDNATVQSSAVRPPESPSSPDSDPHLSTLHSQLSTTPHSPLLRFSHVTIRYGQHTILSDFSWTVCRGEHWALEGPNGSGKSTLLSLVCADNPQAYACDIVLFGRRRGTGESIWDIKRHIGYVSPEMHRAYTTPRQQISLATLPAIDIVASGLHDSIGLYVRPRPEERETCLLWMQRFGISDLADRPFLHLSSGEQRLCLLARAFVKSPDLLILDEPFHGLDDPNRLRATRIIEDYCSDPEITLIIVSHYADELPQGITHHLRLNK